MAMEAPPPERSSLPKWRDAGSPSTACARRLEAPARRVVIGELAAAAGLSTFSAAGLGVKRVRKPRKHEHCARRNQRRRLLPLDLIGNVNAGRSRPTLPLLISPSALKHVFAASRPGCDSVRHSNRRRFLIHTLIQL
jgi:hypothetical protein